MKRIKARQRNFLKNIGLTSLACVAVVLMVALLCFIVIGDNGKICSSVGLTGSVFGCTTEEEFTYKHVAYVLGNTQNVPRLTFDGQNGNNEESKLLKYATNSLYSNDNAKINMYSVSDTQLFGQMVKKKNESDKDKNGDDELSEALSNLSEKRNEVKEIIETSLPTTPGARYYETIERAVMDLDSYRKSENEKIAVIVYGSGLSDSGILNMSGSKLLEHEKRLSEHEANKDSEESGDHLSIYNLLAGNNKITSQSIKNLDIIWYNIGETTHPQLELSSGDVNNLKGIYKDVLDNSFGVDVKFEHVPVNSNKSYDTSLEVTPATIAFPEGGISIIEGEDEIFSFNGGTDEFVEEKEAVRRLAQIANSIKYSGIKSVDVFAYAAKAKTDTDEYVKRLSQIRADRIMNELISNGVDSSIINATGMGHGPNDEYKNGNYFDENIAKRNRIVRISGSKK